MADVMSEFSYGLQLKPTVEVKFTYTDGKVSKTGLLL